jgi:hypothetical protein
VATTADFPEDPNARKAALIEARAKFSGAATLIEHLQLLIAPIDKPQGNVA